MPQKNMGGKDLIGKKCVKKERKCVKTVVLKCLLKGWLLQCLTWRIVLAIIR